eukprot:1150320-Pelagomonas_calceolata.AAC.6
MAWYGMVKPQEATRSTQSTEGQLPYHVEAPVHQLLLTQHRVQLNLVDNRLDPGGNIYNKCQSRLLGTLLSVQSSVHPKRAPS